MSVFKKLAGTTSDSFALGVGNASNKSIQANTGAATPPALRWNNVNTQWEWSNDGVVFSPFLAGGQHLRVQSDLGGATISANSDWTLSIPLDSSDYTKGDCVLMVPASLPSNTNASRASAYYKFGTALNDAQGDSADYSAVSFPCACTFYDRWNAGYSYRTDGQLSGILCWSPNGRYVYLKSIQIVGNQLNFVFHNSSAQASSALQLYIIADLWTE